MVQHDINARKNKTKALLTQWLIYVRIWLMEYILWKIILSNCLITKTTFLNDNGNIVMKRNRPTRLFKHKGPSQPSWDLRHKQYKISLSFRGRAYRMMSFTKSKKK